MAHETVDFWALTDLETPWAIRVVATLGVAEALATGPRSIDEVAAEVACDPDALERVLRHLASKGIFEEPSPRHFALNDAARPLLDPGARIGLGLDGIGGRMAGAWASLLKAVQTGRPAYHEVFGAPFWEDLEANPGVAETFDALMGPGHGTPDGQVLLNNDWDGITTVVDVGGGTGSLLAEVLRPRRALRGILVDVPRVIANAPPVLEAAGVADRVQLVPQSFFDPLPAGAELYLLKSVLGDWPDPEARSILHRCAEALPANGRLVVVGGPVDDEPASPELLMLVLVGGKGRTLSELEALANEAGLRLTNAGRQPQRPRHRRIPTPVVAPHCGRGRSNQPHATPQPPRPSPNEPEPRTQRSEVSGYDARP